MKYLRQWLIIIGLCLTGELISKIFKLPVPGNVIGMLILFLLLITKIVKLEMVEEAGNFLLEHLAFFFLPAGVGLIACSSLLKDSWAGFLFVCIIVTILVIIVTGHSVQLLKKFKRSQNHESE